LSTSIISANHLKQCLSYLSIYGTRGVKEAGAVGKWVGGWFSSLGKEPVRCAALRNPGHGSRTREVNINNLGGRSQDKQFECGSRQKIGWGVWGFFPSLLNLSRPMCILHNAGYGSRNFSTLKFNRKAKPSVRVGRKAADLWIFPIESPCGFCPVGDFETESVAKKR